MQQKFLGKCREGQAQQSDLVMLPKELNAGEGTRWPGGDALAGHRLRETELQILCDFTFSRGHIFKKWKESRRNRCCVFISATDAGYFHFHTWSALHT